MRAGEHAWVNVSSVAELEWCWRCGTLKSIHSGELVSLPIGINPNKLGPNRLEALAGVEPICHPHPHAFDEQIGVLA